MARIEKRNGRWRARVWGPDGRERSRTFDRKTDADRWAATQQADVARGQWVDPALGRLRFADWVSEWEAGLYGLRDGTLELNLSVVRNHLLPRFGGLQLSRITPASVRKMVADDTEAGYSPSAIRRHVFVLRSILSSAVSDGRLGRNVTDDVKLPAERTRPMRFLSPSQVAQVANVIPGHYRALVLTAAWVGLRQGELFGLHMDRVNLLRRAVRVDQQLVDVNGRQSLGPPKTGAGVRTVTIPSTLVDVLGEHFACEPCQSSGLAFPTVTGRPMRRNNFRKLWVRAVAKCFGGTNLEGLVFHELRHTAAALAIAQGAHPMVVKERLGHSSITVTMDRYGHLFPSQDEALAEALDRPLRESLLASTRPDTLDLAHLRRSTP